MVGAGASGVTDIVAGRSSSYISKNGVLYACGKNNYGQLGDGTLINRNTMTPMIGIGTGGCDLINSGQLTFYCRHGGALYAAGSNLHGEICDGSTRNRSQLTAAIGHGTAGVDEIGAGNGHCVIRKGGACYSCGTNTWGQLGDGTNASRTSFVPMIGAGTAGVTALYSGYGWDGTWVIKSGAGYACGKNTYGQSGIGHIGGAANSLTAMVGHGTAGIDQIGINSRTATVKALKGGAVYTCGSNIGGIHGTGDFNSGVLLALAPMVGAGADVTYVWGQFVIKGGKLYCCGNNERNHFGINPNAWRYSSLTQVNTLP